MTEIRYPDVAYMGYDHREADRAARRRAAAALRGIIDEAAIVLDKLEEGRESIDAGDGRRILETAARLPEHLGILEALYQTREWAAKNPTVLRADVASGKVTMVTALAAEYGDALDAEPKGVQDVVRRRQQ
jgi:hypothetical protein